MDGWGSGRVNRIDPGGHGLCQRPNRNDELERLQGSFRRFLQPWAQS
jgi:HAMP domain-containing protein